MKKENKDHYSENIWKVLGKDKTDKPNDPTLTDPAMKGRWVIDFGYKLPKNTLK